MQQIKTNTSFRQEQPLTDLVLEYVDAIKRIFPGAKHPAFTAVDWSPLTALVEIKDFKWVSPAHVELNWYEYCVYLTDWAKTMNWESRITRIHQWQNVVYLEDEEHFTFGDTNDTSHSISVYEFNTHNKIQRIAIYLQHMPSLGL